MGTRVILVDTRPERAEVLAPTLAEEGIEVLACVAPEGNLIAAVVKHRPDLVLIDIDSPDRDVLESLRSVQAQVPRPMVMFTQDDNDRHIREAIDAGVTAYIVDGLEGRKVRPIVEAAMARFTQYRELEDEFTRTRAKLQERKLIERAKGIVMKQQGLGEEQAYQAMRKLAMRKNKRLVDIADSVIAAAELLNG